MSRGAGTGHRFVGRDTELHAVDEALAVVGQGGGPAAVLVVGEPGIGKTTLVERASARAGGLRPFRLSGFEPARKIPLGAAAGLFHTLGTASPEGGALRSLLQVDEAGGGRLEPFRVFEATRVAVYALAPALLVFDDLQWADDTSVALCHYLLRAATGDRAAVGFLLASRPGPHLAGLARALGESADPLVELSLGPLDRDAGVDLVHAVHPGLTSDEAQRLYEAASGSPFWIDALVRRTAGPVHVDDAIGQRLQSLSGDPAECLAAMVVAARPITGSDLVTLLGWSTARTDAAVTTLIDRGLVVAAGPALQVVHDLVRETAYRQVPEREIRRLHRRVADWLEAQADDDLQLLAEALAHRGALGSPSLPLALRIARSPHRRLLGPSGLAQLAAIADGAPLSDPDVTALHVEIATVTAELGEREPAYDRWVVLSDRLPSARERAKAALAAARQAIDLQRSADAAQMIERARAEAAHDAWLLIEADALDHTRRMWVEHDLTGGRAALQRAVAQARTLVQEAGGVERLDAEARRAYVEALSAAWDVALTDDDAPEMFEAAQERVTATRGLGEDHLVAAADAARMLWWSGRWQESATKLTAVLAEARRQVYPALVADLCHVIAFNYYALGRLDEATRLLDEADRIEERLGDRTKRTVPWIRGGLRHLVEASRGDWPESVAALRTRAATYANPHARLRLHQWAGLVAGRFGGPASADLVQAETTAALTDARDAGCRRCYWDVVLSTAESLARVGAVGAARAHLRAWDSAHPQSHLRFALERDWTHALLASAEGDPSAVADLARIADVARDRERRLDELWLRIDLGREQARSDPAAAIETWTAGMRLAESVGAATELKVLQRELRGVGARSRARSANPVSAAVPGLTTRELEVARLVAAGLRNAEIAATLFLSPKTVERHLSSIFTKLAVRSRAELVARYAGRLGVSAPTRSP